jgi:molybdopterin molybdotransferase
MTLSFEQALSVVEEKVSRGRPDPRAETLPIHQVRGRVLAEDVVADRDYPPFNRATRDGYAVRSADVSAVPAVLDCRGEVRAGGYFNGKMGPGHCVEIMTGAPLPSGADAVAMLEHARAHDGLVDVLRAVQPWENVVRQGSEAAAKSVVIRRRRRLGAGEMGLLASVGKAHLKVFPEPRVAILPTGDEVVPLDQAPEWFQIRNSNAVALAAQVAAAGGVPLELPIAPDEKPALRRLIEQGLQADLLLLSGGVSLGRYDFVEEALRELGAEFFFQGVAIRPGKPLVFGRVREKFFFGLPGNPVSTYVTFELFVRPALRLLQGAEFDCPVFLRARLGKAFRQRTGLTAFMPARVEVENSDPVVNLVGWQGSGDLVGVAAANCFLVVHPNQTELAQGDWVDVLPKEQ